MTESLEPGEVGGLRTIAIFEGAKAVLILVTGFGLLSLNMLYFAAGCAVAALLYWQAGFWCLIVPVIVGTAAAVMRLDKP